MLSQALHPVLLEEAGLESYAELVHSDRDAADGVDDALRKVGKAFPVETVAGVQIYRVLQEALNNVSRHSGEREAWVRLKFVGDGLGLDVEDHGKGFAGQWVKQARVKELGWSECANARS